MTQGGTIYAIMRRRWWTGGGYDVIEGTAGAKNLVQAWPVRLAWFKEWHHAEIFRLVMDGTIRVHGEIAETKDG